MSWIDENGVQHKGDLQITSGSPYDKRGEDYNKAIEEAKGDPTKVQAARDALRQGRIDDYKAQVKAANDEYSRANAAADEEYNRAYSNLLALDQSQLPEGYIDKQLKMADQKRQQAKESARAKNKSAVSALKPPAGYNPKDDKEAVRGIVEEEEEKAKADEDAKAKADEAAKSKETTTTAKKKVQPAGAALFSGLSAAAGKMIYGKSGDPMGRDARLERQSEMHDREAAKHDAAAQKENQIANRDERRETSKDALADGATKSKDAVNKLGNVGAGAAALARVTGEGDLNANRNRKDQARQKGVENMEKAEDERQLAEQERSGADVYRYQGRDMQISNQESDELSEGKGDVVQEDNTKKEEDKKVEDNTKVDPPDPEKPEEENAPVEGNWQEAINLLSYGEDASSKHYHAGEKEAEGQRLLDKYDAKPLTMQQVSDYVNEKNPKAASVLWQGGQWDGKSNEFLPSSAAQAGVLQDAIGYYYPKLYEEWKASGQNNGRFDKNGNQINAGQKLADGTTATGEKFREQGKIELEPENDTGSDRRIKNIAAVIADSREY